MGVLPGTGQGLPCAGDGLGWGWHGLLGYSRLKQGVQRHRAVGKLRHAMTGVPLKQGLCLPCCTNHAHDPLRGTPRVLCAPQSRG